MKHNAVGVLVSDFESKTWQELAEICCSKSVRIIGGHLERDIDPLIWELKKLISTETILTQDADPHPYCVLGDIGSTKGKWGRITEHIKYRTKYRGLARRPSITVKRPQITVSRAAKCMLFVNGSNSTRSYEKAVLRNDRRRQNRKD